VSTLPAPRILALPVRVAIVHPQPLLREMLVAWLAQGPRYRVVAELGSGAEALARIPFVRPELVLLDPDLPDLDGERVVRALARDGELAPQIVVLVRRGDAARCEALVFAGARAAVSCDAPPSQLRETLEHVVSRARTSLRPPPRIAPAAVAPLEKHADAELTPRQLRILALVAAGESSRGIGAELGISEKTVLNHRQHIAKRLGLRGVAALTRYAIARGLARP
jgi:DNA-binding NarL/FixJ family response regulator